MRPVVREYFRFSRVGAVNCHQAGMIAAYCDAKSWAKRIPIDLLTQI